MTNRVYLSDAAYEYRKIENSINYIEKPLIDKIIKNCKPEDLFINSIWFENNQTFKNLLNQNPDRIIVYSGMDWFSQPTVNTINYYNEIEKDKIFYIGNSDGDYYFSFWLLFIEKHIQNFNYTPSFKSINKLYLCLNRKRHPHRVKMVKALRENNLFNQGYISLGGDEKIPPIRLPFDNDKSLGDSSAALNNEGIPNDIISLGSVKIWDDYLINIVTETTTGTSTFISEKTWKPILGLKPFLILGDYKIYEYLKDYGIDTFDDMFGIGYLNRNVNGRIQWIVEQLEKYKNSNYLELYKHLYPRLLRNKEQVFNIFNLNQQRLDKVLTHISW